MCEKSRPRKGSCAQSLLAYNRLHQIPRMVHVISLAQGDVIGEEVERNYFENGQQEFGRGRHKENFVGDARDLIIAFGSHGHERAAPRFYFLHDVKRTSVTENRIRIRLVARCQYHNRQSLIDQSVGTVFKLTCGVALSVRIRNFFELQRTFAGNGVVNTAPQIKKFLRLKMARAKFVRQFVPALEIFFDSGRKLRKALQIRTGNFRSHAPTLAGEKKRHQIKNCHLRGKALRRGNGQLRPRSGDQRGARVAHNRRPVHVRNGDGFSATSQSFTLRGNSIGRFARLGNDHNNGVDRSVRRAIAVLARVFDINRDAGEIFDHDLPGQTRMPARSAGSDDQLFEGQQRSFNRLQFAGKNHVVFEMPLNGFGDGLRLFVDFTLHGVAGGFLDHRVRLSHGMRLSVNHTRRTPQTDSDEQKGWVENRRKYYRSS